jgi:glycosyltransferase involved in cell wall biosynthesis
MWNSRSVSVVFPAYNEAENIASAVKEFFLTGVVDEIIVVDNNSRDGTGKIAEKAGAKVVFQQKQGYGWALRKGLETAKGDFIITAEPDGTFLGKDIIKLLSYSDDLDVVFGTRTSKELIAKGAKMNIFLQFGNHAVAKLLQYVHSGPSLTDVGCTMKLIRRDALKKLLPQFRVGANYFSPEFMILCIKNHLRCIEIPVNYKARIGQSKITSSNWKAFRLGLKMIWLIIEYKFRRIPQK